MQTRGPETAGGWEAVFVTGSRRRISSIQFWHRPNEFSIFGFFTEPSFLRAAACVLPSNLDHIDCASMIQTNWFGRGFKLRAAITIACQMVGNTLIRLQCVYALTVSQAFILFGYDQGVFSGIVGNEDWLETFGYPDSALEGIIVSIYNLGAFSGCIVAFVICEKTGRRLAMWIAMGFIIVRTNVENRAKRRHLELAD